MIIKVIDAAGIAGAARKAAADRRAATQWSSDPITNRAADEAAEALEAFASYLEALADEDDDPA